MKRLLLLLLLLMTAFQGFSQTKGISYQAVILNPKAQEIPGANAQNNILANTSVSIEFTVVNASGTEEYKEKHTTKTDRYGMINLLIGTGTQTSNTDFAAIVWNGSTKKLKVGIDFTGGSNFSPLSEQNLTYMPQPPTVEVTIEMTKNSVAIAAEKARALQAEQFNATGITTLKTEQSTQNTAIALNTAKAGITPSQATTISNTSGINTGDQDISGIAINAAGITTLKTEQSTQNTAIALNTAKAGITPAQAIDIATNNAKVSYPGDQDISGIAINAAGITTLKTEQSTQNTAIALNTAKAGITPSQATIISNTSGINTGDQDISGIAINAAGITTLKTEQSTQNTAIALNTAKAGITPAQAIDIATNNAKISYPGDQDISGIAINAAGITTLKTEQSTQNTAIALNTAKAGITPSQATTISNTSGINTGDQDISGIATSSTAIAAETSRAITAEKANADAIATKVDKEVGKGLTTNDYTTVEKTKIAAIVGVNTGDDAVNTKYSSLVTNATHTGDATGATALTVVAINGTSLASLTTGILKNTTTTGVPSIAIAIDFPTLNQNTTGTADNVSGTVAIANGGTGATTKATAFDALSPMNATGDIVYGGTNGAGTVLPKGTANQVLTMNAGTTAPEWTTPATGQTSGTTAGDMQYWNGTAWVIVATTVNEGAALQMISGVPTWVGGTPPTVPDAPIIGTAIGGNGQASVTYTAPARNGGSIITEYTATSSPGNISGTLTQAGSGTINVMGLTNGTTYTFTVTATNTAGDSSSSAFTNSVMPSPPLTVPEAPIIGVIDLIGTSAFVRYSVPTFDGGSPIVYYTVYYDDSRRQQSVISTQLEDAGIAIYRLSVGYRYECTVTATNAIGESEHSSSSDFYVSEAYDQMTAEEISQLFAQQKTR
ncbi:fibronectin type III domain-containing protein [Flavobacterium sp. Arc3]|uniref:fibronectin type III domain-containing protein n=1 Tax=Flavobacterium sp. Arc3 TaxID=3046686 RepID=UPI00352CAF06